MLVVNPSLRVPLREFHFSFSRSSGPGGQNVNKLATKATLRWAVAASLHLPSGVKDRFLKKYHRRITREGELVLTSQRFRDQGRNVADCLEKLRAMLATIATTPRKRKPTKRTRASVERRIKEKRTRSKAKQRRRRPGEED